MRFSFPLSFVCVCVCGAWEVYGQGPCLFCSVCLNGAQRRADRAEQSREATKRNEAKEQMVRVYQVDRVR